MNQPHPHSQPVNTRPLTQRVRCILTGYTHDANALTPAAYNPKLTHPTCEGHYIDRPLSEIEFDALIPAVKRGILADFVPGDHVLLEVDAPDGSVTYEPVELLNDQAPV